MKRERETNQTQLAEAPYNACPVCWNTGKKGVYVPISVFLDAKIFGYRLQCPMCGYVIPNSLCRSFGGKIDDFKVEKWTDVIKNKWDTDLLRKKFNKNRWVESSDLKNSSSLEEDLANAIL